MGMSVVMNFSFVAFMGWDGIKSMSAVMNVSFAVFMGWYDLDLSALGL